MSQPGAPYGGPRQQWKPTAGWQAGRLLRTAAPLLALGWFYLVLSGRANHLLNGDGGAPKRFFLIFAGFLVIFIVALVGSTVAARRRKAGFARLAAEQGWTFQPRDTGGLAARWGWSPFGVGSGRAARNVLLGARNGWPFAAFTYQYTTGSGDDRTTHVLGVIALRLPRALPRLQVQPEGMIGSVAPGLTRTDIDVESEAFNRRYRVACEDRKYAVDVLTPRTVEALLTVQPFRWRIDGADLIAIGKATDRAAEVLATLDILTTVAAGIPGFVWTDRGTA